MELKGYILKSCLGENVNQGRKTYLAEDKDGYLVIKEFASNNWNNYKSLEREFKILSKLKHPQIPKYIGWFEENQSYYLVQEYFEAKNLENRTLASYQVFELARQVLEILIYLESQKIIHKDVKPANILWDNQTAYLVDFGFSSDLNSTPSSSSTLMGTMEFMPPEQLYRGVISHQGDLYSLGITLFCLLKNIPSFEVNKYLDQDYSLLTNDLNVSVRLSNWLSKTIEKNPQKRYISAELALSKLKEALEENIDTKINLDKNSQIQKQNICEVNHSDDVDIPEFGENYPYPIPQKNNKLQTQNIFESSNNKVISSLYILVAIIAITIGYSAIYALLINIKNVILVYFSDQPLYSKSFSDLLILINIFFFTSYFGVLMISIIQFLNDNDNYLLIKNTSMISGCSLFLYLGFSFIFGF